MRGIESDQIVAQKKCQVPAEIVELAKGLSQISLPKNEGLPGIASYGSEMMDPRVLYTYFEINRQTAARKIISSKWFFQPKIPPSPLCKRGQGGIFIILCDGHRHERFNKSIIASSHLTSSYIGSTIKFGIFGPHPGGQFR